MVESMTNGKKSAGAGRIKFRHPPINELVIGVYYPPVHEVKAQHIGMYWDSIQERYPNCEQQFPAAIPFEGQPPTLMVEVPGEVFPLPRFWFSSPSHPTLIQVQRNAFILNWRHAREEEYPHFENGEKDFWKEFAEYRKFIDGIGGKVDAVHRCELTYINLIGSSDFFSKPADIGTVLPLAAGVTGVQNDERRLVGLNVSATYQLNDNLLVDSTAKLGQRLDTRETVAILELKAHGGPRDLSLEGAADWFKTAHDATYELFLSLTNKDVQQTVWKPL
jgi:uncharacterized protein (TIGR04255 family)